MVDAVTQALAAQPTFVPEGWTEENLQKFDDSLRAKGWNEEQIENYKQVGTQVPGNMPVGYSLGILPTVDEGVFGDPKAFIASLEDVVQGYEGLVKVSKEPSGVPKHVLRRGERTEYFDPVMDQTVVYDPMRVQEYERSLKAAKDLLKELR